MQISKVVQGQEKKTQGQRRNLSRRSTKIKRAKSAVMKDRWISDIQGESKNNKQANHWQAMENENEIKLATGGP